jgi:hypothetical protein
MPWNRKQGLADLCTDLVQAVRRRDENAFVSAHQAVVRRASRADAAELTDAVRALAPGLAEVPLGNGGQLAVLAGGLIELGADLAPVLDTLVMRVVDGLERAARFPALWELVSGGADPPAPKDVEQVSEVLERFSATAERLGHTAAHARALAEGWFTVGDWVPGLLVPLQRKEVRQTLPQRERLTRAADALCEDVDVVHWLYGLLRVLDDESVIVLHRASSRGYEMTIGGIGDNFQLHLLLAATLIGDPGRGLIPGTPPKPQWLRAATDGEMEPPGGIYGQFNLVDAFGEWIWNEGRPADIPLLDGRRVIVVDPPPYERSWNAGRAYPLMRPTITLDRLLTADEAARWMHAVAPDKRAR